jgi:hypothetical protein
VKLGGVAEVKSEVEVVPGGIDTKEEVGADKSLEGARVKTQRERSTRQHRERTPKPTTAAQKFRHDQKMAAEMAKVPLSDIKDLEARRREEAWRKMEEELPSTEVSCCDYHPFTAFLSTFFVCVGVCVF